MESESELERQLNLLIYERNQFENNLYDHLLNGEGITFIFTDNEDNEDSDDDFWAPVVIAYNNIERLPDVISEDTCSICTDNHLNFKKVICCGQKLCNGCCYEWFSRSVKCPYCLQDLRDFD